MKCAAQVQAAPLAPPVTDTSPLGRSTESTKWGLEILQQCFFPEPLYVQKVLILQDHHKSNASRGKIGKKFVNFLDLRAVSPPLLPCRQLGPIFLNFCVKNSGKLKGT